MGSHMLDLSNVSIALLRLLPGKPGDEIVCDVRTVPLKSDPVYETLSYVWGDQTNTRQITCDGSPRVITESLYLALSRLRLRDRPRTVWIDQLCIDQTNDVEKSLQVSVMRDIYRKASRGLIWLGELPTEEQTGFPETHVALVFQCLTEMITDLPNAGSSADEVQPRHLGEVILALMGSQWAKWQGVKWWQRIWTIQEAKLPVESDLMWGGHTLSFDILKRVAVGLVMVDSGVGQRFEQCFALGPLSNEFCIPLMNLQINDPAPTLGPLYRWRSRDAMNPLDKIYALMGLLPEGAFKSVPFCNYTISETELYTRVTFDLIRHHEGLLPVCGRRGEPRMTPGLPSWVVDWTFADDPTQRTTDYFGHCWRYNFFKSSGGKYVEPEMTPDGTGLVVQGARVDKIAVLGSVNYLLDYRQLSTGEYDEHTLHTISLWSSVFYEWLGDRSIDELYIGNKTMTCLEAICRVLIGDLVYNGSEPDHRASQEDVARVQNYARGSWDPQIAESARDMARSQAFFITESGYFGIGPPDAKIGDEVWVLLCGKVPHVIRRSSEKSLEFEYVGDAYVQGIMDGEVIAKSPVAIEQVTLK
ncbi:HET domain-containing protein [Fusarium sp. LHS14.1]|nr:HET domain-containing protein [Fusarium sp. LHS14.1]